MKKKTVFLCNDCGDDFAKWAGKCPTCGAWGTLSEMTITESSRTKSPAAEPRKPVSLDDILTDEPTTLLDTGISEINNVLGGGLTLSSIVLLSGEPGIGKSTLAFQLTKQIQSTLYISAEESESQIAVRAKRLGITSEKLNISSENRWEAISKLLEIHKPDLLIIDSIQTIFTESIDGLPGSLSQVRECGSQILNFCKPRGITTILVGHITKDGKIAGPKMLEHLVDVVLNLEGDNRMDFRILRCTKNRFGATHNTGIFEMTEAGLIAVENPSQMFLAERSVQTSGSVVVPVMEGNRPVLIEVQGLVSPATYGNPQRNATGFDMRRLSMLLAILDKRLGYQLGTQDVFVNMVGGLKLTEPALDLAIVLAIASSYRDIPIDEKIVSAGEIGLSGEVRGVQHLTRRIKEAERLGFEKFICPASNLQKFNQKTKMRLIGVSSVYEAIEKSI
ncbi:MAG: DNA repair protein RadA [Candidatus Marinimicrobia bacterium]|nr:DNA repair protein RadA [Candidatus Neomarinimicrobiota bacterium]MBL7022558.1 DNA repair protein RadA [Candidatus Neomarinimicrobiota bacterium]MBL7108914.1 DNA repair protein RadA [Candidatus Neomarinimicrobiota bacterium]